jgi:hypothetical protein
MPGLIKPTCGNCRYRRNIPGDAHSACHALGDPASALTKMFVDIIHGDTTTIYPVFDRHGVEAGWVHWPVNFDPVWLQSCTYFRPKEKESVDNHS